MGDLKELKRDMKENPEKYTQWFKIILPKLLKTNGHRSGNSFVLHKTSFS
jgi:hypothetical protein